MSETLLGPTKTTANEAAIGRFFMPADITPSPWLIGIVNELPGIREAGQAAHQETSTIPESVWADWRRDPTRFPRLNILLDQQHKPADRESTIRGEGYRISGLLLEHLKATGTLAVDLGRELHRYWLGQVGEKVYLFSTDDSGEPLIYHDNYDAAIGPDSQGRPATVDDYIRLLLDASDQQ